MKRYVNLNITTIIALLCGILMPLSAIAEKVPASGKAADVNGTAILYADYERQLTMFQKQVMQGQPGQLPEALMQRLKNQVIRKMVGEELLYQEAVKNGLTIDDKAVDDEMVRIKRQFKDEKQYQAQLKASGHTEKGLRNEIHRQASISQLIKKEIVPEIDITPEEAKAYYEKNKNRYRQPEKVHAQHILMKTEKSDSEEKKAEAKKKLQDLQKRILAGEDFGELAKEHSQGPSNVRGGDLGYFTRGRMVKPFEDAAFKLAPNEVSDIVETQYGYHLIKVVDRQAEINPSFEEVQPKINSTLFNQQIQKRLEPYVAKLREKAKIEIYVK